DRHPKVERVPDEGAVKFCRRDTDDRVLDAIEVLRLADDSRVTVVAILPSEIANHCDRMRVATVVFFWSESATEHRLHTEGVKIVCSNKSTRCAFGSIADAETCPDDPIDDERFEQC